MALTFCEEQVEADAERVKGAETSELLAGLLTVTPAIAGIETETASDEEMKSARVMFIGFLMRADSGTVPLVALVREPNPFSFAGGLF